MDAVASEKLAEYRKRHFPPPASPNGRGQLRRGGPRFVARENAVHRGCLRRDESGLEPNARR
jgi:hypothetical protein